MTANELFDQMVARGQRTASQKQAAWLVAMIRNEGLAEFPSLSLYQATEVFWMAPNGHTRGIRVSLQACILCPEVK